MLRPGDVQPQPVDVQHQPGDIRPRNGSSSETPPEYLCRKGPEFEYQWQIENFSMCPHAKGQFLESTSIVVDSLDRSEFKLVLYPRGRGEDQNEPIWCFLECITEPDYNINVTVQVLGQNKSVTMTETRENFILRNGKRTGFVLLSDRRQLVTNEQGYMPDDVFTIRCVITPEYPAPFASDEDLLGISRDFGSLLESGDFSDFVIRGSEGEKYRVHKIILTIRSRNLAQKLGLLDDKPKTEGSVTDMNPAVLKAVLEYVYTGKLKDDLTPDLLNEVYEAAKRYSMDDLERDVFPVETRIIAGTIVKVDRRTISWALRDFEKIMDAGNWPLRTLVDLTHGRFVITFSVIMSRENKPLVQIDIYSQSLMVDGSVLIKCEVLVDRDEGGHRFELCRGEHIFDHSNAGTCTFSMRGEHKILYSWPSLRRYPDIVTLVFRFALSAAGSSSKCRKVEVSNSLVAPDPAFNRSYQRLSSDLDIVFRDTIGEVDHDMDWDPGTFSDLVIRSTKRRIALDVRGPHVNIRGHSCILAARSSKFREDILATVGSKKKTATLELFGMKQETEKIILRYLYSGKMLKMEVDLQKQLDLYSAAAKYKLPILAKKYMDAIKTKMTASDIYPILLHAEDDHDETLFSLVQQFIMMNKRQVLGTPEWNSFASWSRELASIALRYMTEDERAANLFD